MILESAEINCTFFFHSETAVKTLWEQFRQDDPGSTFQFEKFLSSISDSIHSKEKEKVTMEEFIRIQNETHEEEVSSAEVQEQNHTFRIRNMYRIVRFF